MNEQIQNHVQFFNQAFSSWDFARKGIVEKIGGLLEELQKVLNENEQLKKRLAEVQGDAGISAGATSGQGGYQENLS